jgi:catechol 2,3-dioxygenase-like lactoylglutathione lyase family enzyme
VRVRQLDHLVLTVANIQRTTTFYSLTLGMEIESFGDGRIALRFGNQKINLHEFGHEFEPKARHPTPGSADLCFITDTPIADLLADFKRLDVPIELGPVERTGAIAPIESVYIRDPDANLIEIANLL